MNPEVERLVLQVRDGDTAAFRQLYDLYARKVLNFCFRLTGSREIAEDVTQETFISVFRNIGNLKDMSRFEPWLYMIARNYVYQAYRRRRPMNVSTDETDEEERETVQLESSEGSPESQVLEGEFRGVAMEAIQSLSLKYREVFVLAVLEGYSYRDVAEMVGRKVQSVKTDIHRARLRIREKLGHYL